jgi:hypothetical protein
VDQAALKPDKCFVTGLKGYTVSDKVTKAQPHVNKMEKIVIDGEVDWVYDPPPNGMKNYANVMLWEPCSCLVRRQLVNCWHKYPQ